MKHKTYTIIIEDKQNKENVYKYGILFHRVDAEILVNFLRKSYSMLDRKIYYKEKELDSDRFILP